MGHHRRAGDFYVFFATGSEQPAVIPRIIRWEHFYQGQALRYAERGTNEMQRSKQWITLSVVLVMVAVSAAAPVINQSGTALARQTDQPLVFLKDGDIWSWNGSAVTRLTTWGYNERPILSPTGQWIAYNSWAQITIDAVSAGQPVMGFIPSNIWVMDPRTGTSSAFRAADQPANAVLNGDIAQTRAVMRGTPTWSPGGDQLAWVELAVPESFYQLVVFDMSSRTSRVLVSGLPSPFADGGFIPVHDVIWSAKGIIVVNLAVNSATSDFEETLYLYDPASGAQISVGQIGSSATEFPFQRELVMYNNTEYFGVLYPSGKRFLIEPASLQQQDMPALPELISRFVPDNSATAFVGASIDANSNLTKTWTVVYPNRTQDDLLNFTGEDWNIGVAPDGRAVAYFSDALHIWRDGQISTVPGTEGVASPWDVGLAWSPTGWRVRTDWPGTGSGSGGSGGGAVACTLAPRLSIGASGQVLPGLPNVIRSQPRRGTDSPIIGEIPGGGVFTVLNGPQCGPEGRYWWQVTYQGITGWTAEGQSGIYWLQPYQVSPPPVTCTLAPRLTVGSTAMVLPGLPNVIRTQPRRGADSLIIGRIPGGGFFTVLSGPQCGPEGRYWYQVNYNGVVGYTAEGERGTYWLAPFGCRASPLPRLAPGMQAVVTPGAPNRLRSGPGTNYDTIGQIPGGGFFTVLSGPQCGPEGWSYWRVQYGNQVGWTAEGDGGTYWLEPYQWVPNPVPTPAPVTCSPTPRLQVGVAGRVLPGEPNALRSQPRRGSDSALLLNIPAGGIFGVESGPVCDSEGIWWWRVDYQGVKGWTPEGQAGVYWAEPYPGDGPGTACMISNLAIGATGYVVPGPANVLR
ncbi:MAG: SH3 domain-containing protein, partial [Anaerolineae bacterium]|nr:SH3 domain-containing protein [Anaerolineae bacterium]